MSGKKGREKGSVHEFRNFADEGLALKMLKRGLRVLGIKGSNLEVKAKGTPEKQVLTWWLRKKTVGSRRWIRENLGMGDLSRHQCGEENRFGEGK